MKMIISGKKVDASDGSTIEILNPATQEYIDNVPSATDSDIEMCLDAAQKGKKEWSTTPLSKRTALMEKYAAAINEHLDELAELQCKEMGKPIAQCRGEISHTAELFKSFAEHALHLYDIVMPESVPGLEKDIMFTKHEPLGVILCVIPFNYPAAIYAHKVAPAIAMGNAVIVKPASTNPLIVIRLIELLIQCGMPDNAVQVITGKGSVVGKKLVPSNKINAVALTGSTEVGIDIAKSSAQTLHRQMLELGGNDPLIVFEDADLDYAVSEAYNGRIVNAGQVCSSSKRLIVQNSIKQAFTDKLAVKLKNTIIGDPMNPNTEMGCLVSEAAAIDVEEKVKHTISQGAKCIYGGKRFNKTFFEPTLLVDVKADMDIASDLEIFGPVFPVIGFDTEEEAIEIANNSIFGLDGGVITRDFNKGTRVAFQIEAGTVVVNGTGCYRHKDHAFGGYKMSGYGHEGISVALEENSQIKTCVLKGILK